MLRRRTEHDPTDADAVAGSEQFEQGAATTNLDVVGVCAKTEDRADVAKTEIQHVAATQFNLADPLAGRVDNSPYPPHTRQAPRPKSP